ncbi:DUF2318 domain-containing protein [Patescibacteria group bacterium]|nr:DUF2318 domain-containing protein [Patescibacteria group bacterium]
MFKKYLPFIIIGLVIVVGGGITFGQGGGEKSQENNTEAQCEINEMVFYYLDSCSWCQKVKSEKTVSKLESLGVRVEQIRANVGPVRHQFQGVPTFVINENIYSGYKTFEELKELLKCSEDKQILSQPESPKVEFFGENGENVSLINGQVSLTANTLDDNLAHYYNTKLPSGKTVYFFVVKDKNGVYRAAANACQVCFDSRMGFRQQGDFMVCNTCGNKYPLGKIATEKGGCNPGPINPDLKVKNGKLTIKQAELEEVAELF